MLRLLSLAFVLLSASGCDSIGRWLGEEPTELTGDERSTRLPISRHQGLIAAPTSDRPVALAVGQWTRHRIHHPGGKTTDLLRQIVGTEAAGLWLEIVSGTPDAGTVTQLLIAKTPPKAGALLHVLAAQVRMPNGIIKRIDGTAMDATRAGYQRLLSDVRLGATWEGKQGPLRVAAGDFSQVVEVASKMEFAGLEATESAQFHSTIPIGGLAKAVRADGSTAVELTGYGAEGAYSVLNRRSGQR